MTPLGPSEIRARRRPGVILAIAAVRLFAGFCLAFPLGSLVAASGIGLRAEGDRALFEGGGYLLLELLRLQSGELLATARGLMPLFALGLVLTGACNVALLVALNVRERLRTGPWLSRVVPLLPAQLVVAAGAALTKIAVILLAASAVGSVPEWLAKPVDTTLAQVATLAPFLALCGAIGGFEDITKATLVRHPAPVGEGLARAWQHVKIRPFSVCFGWVPWAVLFATVALLAARLVDALDVSRPGAWRIACVFAAHQLVILVSVACRSAWFAKSLRVVATG